MSLNCVRQGWEQNTAALWSVILFLSVLSPVSVWLCLPFIRGEGSVANYYVSVQT